MAEVDDVIKFIRQMHGGKEFVPLHEPCFVGNEKKYLNECIDSTFVSSVGKFVDRFEHMVAEYTGAKYAVATVNGTAGLHVALLLAGVLRGDEVITQPLTFVATCNAISYVGARPVFVDVAKETMGLSAEALEEFLARNAAIDRHGQCVNQKTGCRISACVPMHTFGHPCQIDAIEKVCDHWNICLVEDAAESLGSTYQGKHTGTFGRMGVFSFNGNKTITTGGGGMIVTDDEELARRAKHLTTTAKLAHPYEYVHDEVGYNYRLPNLNAALGCAQMEQLPGIITKKRELAEQYQIFLGNLRYSFVTEPQHSHSNYWLNAVVTKNRIERDLFLEETNSAGVMTRPVWRLMDELELFSDCPCGDLTNAKWFADRIVNIPSSVKL